jgi:hypothetical protein
MTDNRAGKRRGWERVAWFVAAYAVVVGVLTVNHSATMNISDPLHVHLLVSMCNPLGIAVAGGLAWGLIRLFGR